MRRRQFLKKMSVFHRYLISYMSLVIFVCSLLGFVLFNHYIRTLNEEMRRVNDYKLSLVAADLDAQWETLEDIALNIAVSLYYKPFYIAENAYYEQDLLKDFAKYDGASPIVEEYFFFYRGADRLFKNGGKNTFSLYLGDVLGFDGWQDIQPLIEDAGDNTLLELSCGGQPRYLLVYPVHTTSRTDSSGDAFLCFITSPETLQRRARNIAGELPGAIQIQYGGHILEAGNGAAPSADSITLSAVSPEGLTRVALRYDESAGMLEGIRHFQKASLFILFLLIVVFLGLSAVLAYSNYRPIKNLERIEKDYMHQQEGAAGNELDNLEAMFRSIADLSAQNRKLAESQWEMLRRQTVNNLLSEGLREEFSEMLDRLGIALPGPRYCVISAEVDNLIRHDKNAFFSLVDSLPKDRFVLYAGAQRPNRSYGLLCSLPDGGAQRPAAETLLNACARSRINLMLGVSSVFEDPGSIPAAYLESQIALNRHDRQDDPILYYDESIEEGFPIPDDQDALIHLVKALHLGCRQDALDCLSSILGKLEHQAVSLQRHVCSSVLMAIIRAAHDRNIEADPKKVIAAIVMPKLADFEYNASSIIGDVCAAVAAGRKDENREKADRILGYIHDHYHDYFIGLKELSDRFDTTPTSLSRFIKHRTGETFRNYITLLRIDRAKEILIRESQSSLNDVSGAIGYESVSHFIRAFKKITGMTPAQYRRVNITEPGNDFPAGLQRMNTGT